MYKRKKYVLFSYSLRGKNSATIVLRPYDRKFQIVTKEFSLSLDRQASISSFIALQQDSINSEKKYFTFRKFFIIVDFFWLSDQKNSLNP